MIRQEIVTITEEVSGWRGVSRATGVDASGSEIRVLSYVALTGTLASGQRVLVNTNALRRGLGTGGDAFAITVLDSHERESMDPFPSPASDPRGHMVKARYLPQQVIVNALDDPASEHAATIDAVRSLEAIPVIVADLHSALPAIVAGYRIVHPDARLVYIHTDWASLRAEYSATNAALRSSGLLDATITAGQASGGDYECVTLASAYAAAKAVLDADAVIVAQGPGNLGTGTAWGFSGFAAADALNLASRMGATPYMALRVSGADPRERHRGLSHHSTTVLERGVFTSVRCPVPAHTSPNAASRPDSIDARVRSTLEATARSLTSQGLPAPVIVETPPEGIIDALDALPVRLSTMGRTLEDDPAPFLYAALAGRAAALGLEAKLPPPPAGGGA